jgi:hypothetical protein
MSSPSHDMDVKVGPPTEGLSRLLDLVFGFFIWAAHFLIVYVGTALACALGLGAASSGARMTLLTTLALVTVAAAAIVVLHALQRYRQQRELPEQHFPMYVTVGCDAIALVGIVWQLFPILLVPACA